MENADVWLLAASETSHGLRWLLGGCFGSTLHFLGVRGLGGNIGIEQARQGNGRGNADNRGQSEHQPNHDTREVAAEQSVDDNEDMLIAEILKAHVDTGGEEPYEEVEIKEERGPGSRLMLGYRGNDRNMNLGIAGIPEGVEATIPWRDIAEGGQTNQSNQANTKGGDKDGNKEGLELAARNGRSYIFNKGNQLEEAEDAWPKISML